MSHLNSHHSSEWTHASSEVKPSFLSRLGRLMKKTMKNIVFQVFSLIIALVGMGITYAAWTTLTSGQWASGQVITAALMQGVINNVNDLNTRVSNLSAATAPSWTLCGLAGDPVVLGGISTQRISCNGSNPYISCPSGYTRVNSSQHYFCAKD